MNNTLFPPRAVPGRPLEPPPQVYDTSPDDGTEGAGVDMFMATLATEANTFSPIPTGRAAILRRPMERGGANAA